MQGQTKSAQKDTNRSLVLKLLREQELLSRVDIAETLGLNRSTITSIVNPLIGEGIVIEVAEGDAAPKGGRKPVYLGINKDYGCVMGMEIRHDRGRISLMDFHGKVLTEEEIDIPGESRLDIADRFFILYGKSRQIIAGSGTPLVGIGCGLSGYINPYTGTVIESAAFDTYDYNFFIRIQDRIPVPVILDNDANCCAWGELVAHRKEGPDNFVFLLPTFTHSGEGRQRGRRLGIGMGIVIGRSVYYGERYSSGEFKSFLWKKGNLEQISWTPDSPGAVPVSPEIFKTIVEEICSNLSVLVSVLNPGRVYIGGDFGPRYEEIMHILDTTLKDRFIGMEEQRRLFQPADFSEYDVARGAGCMFLERLFEIPGFHKDNTFHDLNWKRIFGNRITGVE